MNEKEIAANKVIPELERLGWPKYLITQYGRVPVQMGTDIKWADIVLLIVDDENESAIPYAVFEVKSKFDNLNEILAQTDSYSKFLDAPYFAITNGADFHYYQRKPSGGYMEISNIPKPSEKYLTVTQNTKFKPGFILCSDPTAIIKKEEKTITQYDKKLDEKINGFFQLITKNRHYYGTGGYCLRADAIWHYLAIKRLNNLIHKKADSLKPHDFKECINHDVMCHKPPNKNNIFFEVDKNFGKIKEFLDFIKDFRGDPEINITKLLDINGDLHIKGMGIFVISQFLAGAHPQDYTIVQDRMVNTLKEFGLIDTKVKANTAKGYLYINDICKKLCADVFRNKIEENRDKLGFNTDDDLGLVMIHQFFWEITGFNYYDRTKLREATGKEKNECESTERRYLDELNNVY